MTNFVQFRELKKMTSLITTIKIYQKQESQSFQGNKEARKGFISVKDTQFRHSSDPRRFV